MTARFLSMRRAALAAAIALCAARDAQAGSYLVCYLPPDAAQRLIRFCPGASGAAAGEPCNCLLRSETLAGTMTAVDIPDAGINPGADRQTMCVSRPAATVALCPVFRPTGDAGCECDGATGGGAGERYTVGMIPRVPLRTNQSAAADFLRRLQECCVSK